MPEAGLEVTISAKTTSLEAQTSVAKAEMNAFASTVRATAKAVTTASEEMKEALEASLLQQVEELEAARAHWAALEAQTKKSAEAAQESAGFFGKISEGVEKSTKSIEGMTEKLAVFSKLSSAVGEFVVGGLALEQVGEAINHVAETGEQLGKLSEETGLSTEALSALRVIAVQTATDFGQVQTMLQRLPNTLQQAVNDPAGKAGEAFRAMGIQVTNANGQIRPMADILDEVSAKLSSYADGANKTALETDIFGSKIGANLLPFLLKLGQEGLPGAIEESTRLGETWTGVDSDAATKFEEDLHTVAIGVEGIADSIIRKLLPALDDMAQGFALATGTASIDDQIANVQQRINQLGVRAGVGLRDQLTKLEAEKAQIGDSAASQAAIVNNAPPGTVQAPSVGSDNSRISRQGGFADQADPALQGDNIDSSGEAGGGGDGGVAKAKSAQEQMTQIAQDAASARKAIATAEYDAQVANWDAEVSSGKIAKAQEVQDEIDAKNKMYAADLNELQKEASADAALPVEKAKVLDDILVLQADHNAEMAKLNDDLVTAQAEADKKIQDAQTQAANATAQAWQRALQPINQAFDSSINGVIQGTQTLQQAEMKAAQSIALAFIDAEAKKVVAFVEGEALILARVVASELGMTAATTAGETTRLAVKSSAAAAGKAQDVATGAAQIESDAYKAAAGAYAAVAGIPYVGPVLAPAAAAAAYAGVMTFDVLSAEGGMAVPAGVNPLVQLHEKEMVLPAYIAQPLSSMVGGMGAGGGGDTSISNTFHNTYHGAGNLDEDSYLAMLNSAVRSGRLQKYPAIARMMRR